VKKVNQNLALLVIIIVLLISVTSCRLNPNKFYSNAIQENPALAQGSGAVGGPKRPHLNAVQTGVVKDILIFVIVPIKHSNDMRMMPFHNMSIQAIAHSLHTLAIDSTDATVISACMTLDIGNGKTMEIPACEYVGQKLGDIVYAASGQPLTK